MGSDNSDTSDCAVHDVIVIGAGISGINLAYRLKTQVAGCNYVVLEERDNIGGTWDLFRYPGIRSDSDLYTFAFSWHPWNRENPIAEGEAIRAYLHEATTVTSLYENILFQHRVSHASWSSDDQQWVLVVDTADGTVNFRGRFIVFATGYYDYHEPFSAEIPGLNKFSGEVIHPQFWPESFDYRDKCLIVIGSGATAITLVPTLAREAAQVTMVQRSPSYIVSIPNRAPFTWFGRYLPTSFSWKLRRWWYLIMSRLMVSFCLKFPNAAKSAIKKAVTKQLPHDVPFDPHFKPRYNPWEQRLCLCPDSDFFESLASGRATVETDTIKEVLSDGLVLSSGKKLNADAIITATGLKVQIAGSIVIEVDGKEVEVSNKYIWNGAMLQDIPNAALIIGYTNASWTLGADANAQLICRLLGYMERSDYGAAIPRRENMQEQDSKPVMELTSTYIKAAANRLPRASNTTPWVSHSNYMYDMLFAKYGRIYRGLKFVRKSSQ